MSFSQEIFILLYLFGLGEYNTSYLDVLRDDVYGILKCSGCSEITYSDFKRKLLAKALPYSSRRVQLYLSFIRFIDKYLDL